MPRPARWILLGLCVAASCLNLAQGRDLSIFTEQEKAWIAAHPTVKLAVEPDFSPIEFVEDGVLKGVCASYLAAISERTGLQFEVISQGGWEHARKLMAAGLIDLLPVAANDIDYGDLRSSIMFTEPYITTYVVAVANKNEPVIFSLRQLEGKTVAVKSDGRVHQMMRRLFPSTNLLTFNSPQQALDSVVAGKAYASLGLGYSVLPLMQRGYGDSLAVAGTFPELAGAIRMAVRSDRPELYSIINKTLGSLTAEQTDQIDQRWIDTIYYKTPDLWVTAKKYSFELFLALVVIVLLSVFFYRERALKKRAVSSELEKSKFLAVMSHEVRTPMNAIYSSLELLERKTLLPAHAELVKLAVGGARTLLGLLDDVLDYCKLEARKVRIEPRPVDVKLLLEQIVAIVRIRAVEKGIAINFQATSPSGFSISIDAGKFHQIINNLLSNAIKFTHQGQVDVALSIVPSASKDGHGRLLVSVADTGIGIPLNRQHDLFSPFTQVAEMRSSKAVGTGLGLTICKELVDLMLGTIDLKSVPGKGTCIDVSVPVEFVAPGLVVHEEVQPASHEGSAHLSILVVDDHPDNCTVITHQLQELGYNSTSAGTGQEALKSWRESRYDLILLDCQLPDMDGYSVARQIRHEESEDGGFTPIIAISALHGMDHQQACLDAGIDGVLSKPLRLKQLAQIIELWCGDGMGAELQATTSEPAAGSAQHPSRIELRAMFIGSTRSDVAALNEAVVEGKWELVNKLAHRIHGAALVIDFAEVASLSGDIERLTHELPLTEVDAVHLLLLKLDKAVEQLSET